MATKWAMSFLTDYISEEVMALANTMKLARFANGPLARYPLPQIYLLGEFFTMLLSIIIELVIRNMASLATTGFKQCLLNTPPTQVGARCFKGSGCNACFPR